MRQSSDIKVFKRDYLESIYKLVDSDHSSVLENKHIEGFNQNVLDPRITLEKDVTLDHKVSDFTNSRVLFEGLKLNPTSASDPRLWTYLALVPFKEYMQGRWPISSDIGKDKRTSRIKSRYFMLKPSLRSLTRHGIARLWWFSYLTYDESRSDRFELTRVLTERQDLIVGLLERMLGANRRVRLSILEYLALDSSLLSSEKKTRIFLKRLNLIAGIKNISILKKKELFDIYNLVNTDETTDVS